MLNHVNQKEFNRVSNELITWYGGLQAIQSKPSDREYCCVYVDADLIQAVNKLTGLTALYKNIGYWYPSSITMKPTYQVIDEILIAPSAFENKQSVSEFVAHIISNENNRSVSWLVPTEHLEFFQQELVGHGVILELADLGQTDEQSSTN